MSFLLSNSGDAVVRDVTVHLEVGGTRDPTRQYDVSIPAVPPGLFGWGSFPFPAESDGSIATVKKSSIDLSNATVNAASQDALLSEASFPRKDWDIDLLVRPSGAEGVLVVSVMFFDKAGVFVAAVQQTRKLLSEADPKEQKVRVALPAIAGSADEVRVALSRGAAQLIVDGVVQP